MTTTLDTSCSENTMVLSARRGFLHASTSYPGHFASPSAKMALASAGHVTSKSPVFGVFNYDNAAAGSSLFFTCFRFLLAPVFFVELCIVDLDLGSVSGKMSYYGGTLRKRGL